MASLFESAGNNGPKPPRSLHVESDILDVLRGADAHDMSRTVSLRGTVRAIPSSGQAPDSSLQKGATSEK